MEFQDRVAAGYALRGRWPELTGRAFQTFFHRLMQLRHREFIPVRPAGSMGDQGSDGLLLDAEARRCYACYGPWAGSPGWASKFNDDLASALRQRFGSFDTFVFVYNDIEGAHPTLSSAVSQARLEHPDLTIELLGFVAIQDELCQLTREQAEQLLGGPLVTAPLRVGLADVEPLLRELSRDDYSASGANGPLEPPTSDKLDYSRLSQWPRDSLLSAMTGTPQVEQYYQRRIDVTERDRVAVRFRAEYDHAIADGLRPDEVLCRLREFVVGTALPDHATLRAADVVLAAFFETCDIFDNPPPGWRAEILDRAP